MRTLHVHINVAEVRLDMDRALLAFARLACQSAGLPFQLTPRRRGYGMPDIEVSGESQYASPQS